jgi:recombination associated protein RdgC
MLFKQALVFQLNKELPTNKTLIESKLERLAFSPCPPSFSTMSGWVSPLQNEHGSLLHTVGKHLVFCMQMQEKVLPASVVRHEVDEKIKQIQTDEDRKVYQKEKTSIREETTMTMLPKAFSQYSLVYAYIDVEQGFLVINTSQKTKVTAILSLMKKSLGLNPAPYPLKKMSYLLSQWLMAGKWPDGLDVLQYAVLQDPNDTKRTVRCQQQDLFSSAILSFIKNGHEVTALQLAWHHGVEFTLTDQLILKGIKYSDELRSADEDNLESKDQRFDTDLCITTETFSILLPILIDTFADASSMTSIPEEERELETV